MMSMPMPEGSHLVYILDGVISCCLEVHALLGPRVEKHLGVLPPPKYGWVTKHTSTSACAQNERNTLPLQV